MKEKKVVCPFCRKILMIYSDSDGTFNSKAPCTCVHCDRWFFVDEKGFVINV